MWLFTRLGFYSIVRKPHASDLTVRARVRADLDALRQRYLPQLSPTLVLSGTDYRYRATVSHVALSAAMAAIVMDLEYDNYKSEVAVTQGARRAHVYANVWSVLADGLPPLDHAGRRPRQARREPRVNTPRQGSRR